MRPLLFLAPLLLATACKDKDSESGDLEDGSIYSLVFTMEDSQASAGEAISYMAYLDGGLEPIVVDVVPSSDVEELQHVGAAEFMATIADEHVITGTAVYDGATYTAELPLAVNPGVPVSFDLSLTDVAAGAGDPLGYAMDAWDEFGNMVDTSSAVLEIFSADVREVEGNLISTVPGLYDVLGTFSSFTDLESFVIYAGAPAGIELLLDEDNLELDETALATVTVVDAYGNPVDDNWDLWVEPGINVDVNYNAVTFGAEGRYTVWAASSDGAYTDSVGPLLIDSTGPVLGIENPMRGLQTTETGMYVEGTATEEYTGLAGVTVNGVAADVSEDGSWSAWTDYDFGTNFVHTEGTDGDGNVTSDLRAVLSGEYNYYSAPVEDGITIRLSEQGFEDIGSLALDLIAVDELLTALPNPVLDESEETCIDIIFDELCFEWYSIELTIEELTLGAIELDIDPRSSGYLETTLTVNDFYMELDADGVIAEIPYSIGGDISADAIVVGMDLYPYISGASLALAIPSLYIDLQGFDLDNGFYDVIEDVLDFFGLDINALLADLIEGLIEDLALEQITEILQDVLAGLDIAVPLDLNGNTYTLEALFSRAVVDEEGMSLGLSTYFTAQTWLSGDSVPGSLDGDYIPPSYGGSSDTAMELGLSLDFLNQLFHALWGGGLLEMELASEDLGLDVADFELFLPELTALSIGTRAYQPPVVLPGTDGALMDLQLGDLELSLYNGDIREENLWMRIYVNVQTALELDVTEDSMLSAGLGELDISFDLAYPNDTSAYADDAELLLETLVPLLLPTLTDALGEIPIPELEGFTLTDFDIAPGGDDNGYMTIGGSLSAAE